MENTTQQPTAEELLQRVRAMFACNQAALGTPDKPTKEGFLALAREGKDIWNAWRLEWSEPAPDFSGVDFRAKPQNFSGFHFTNCGSKAERLPCVIFCKAKFGDSARLHGVRSSPITRFDGAQFGDRARFDDAQFGEMTWFDGAQFGARARFVGARFDGLAVFHNAKFGGDAKFDGAWFSEVALFQRAQFGGKVSFKFVQFDDATWFENTHFGKSTRFDGTRFAGVVWFLGAQFGGQASFDGARLGTAVNFDGARFGGKASFNGVQFGAVTSFDGAEFSAKATFAAWDVTQLKKFLEEKRLEGAIGDRPPEGGAIDLSSDAFGKISFCGAQFSDEVTFAGRQFKSTTAFGPLRKDLLRRGADKNEDETIPLGRVARFGGVSKFHGCTLNQDTSFDDAEFKAPQSAEAARAYRTLKLAFAQQQAIREEQFFFKLEMRAEAAIAKGVRRAMFWLYETLADFGFSLRRPLCLWLFAFFGFGLVYGLIAGPLPYPYGIDWSRTAQWATFAFINAIPLPGFDSALRASRAVLFGSAQGWLLAVTVAELLHRAVSLLALFLAGLALRNLFKMKG